MLKSQKSHNTAVIEATCSLFVFGSIAPSIQQKISLKDQIKLEVNDASTPIMTSRCKQAAKCIHSMCVEFDKCLN